MEMIKFIYYQDNEMWVGWLEEYPDYKTQGKTIEELKEKLKDIYKDINSGKIPQVRRYGELAAGKNSNIFPLNPPIIYQTKQSSSNLV